MYDYIIVGAGSAGCVLANRLSANPNNRVLLLEAGGRDWSPFIHMPAGLARLVTQTSLNWNYNTSPQKNLNNRELFWPRGKVLGGSSSINAMCYIRGQAEDYDHWAQLGNKGWGFSDVLPYFIKSESNQRGSSVYHGDSGPQCVSDLRHTNELSHAFVDAGHQLGFPVNNDFNAARQSGFGFYQVTQKNGRRCSTAVGYLDPAKERPNLTIKCRARAEQVLFDGLQARGVQYHHQGQVTEAEGARVILAGGAINSPQLLLLSGIGAGAHLQECDIQTMHELPGVGENLQDHLDVCVIQSSKTAITYDQPNEIAVGMKYWMTHSGIGSSNVAEAGAFIASSKSTDLRPDIQLHFVPAQLDDHGRNRLSGHGMTIHSCFLRPYSRGNIKLTNADPQRDAIMNANYLSDARDIEVLIEGAKISRDLFATDAFAEYRETERTPGKSTRTHEQWSDFIRRKAETIYHPVGTCKMGNDAMAVVDQNLNVHGLQGISVVDASIMPTLVSGNTNAPTIMIAEKAADYLLNVA